ncbi:hypothetical protein Landi51_09638 [Colletotrichum acutatum]
MSKSSISEKLTQTQHDPMESHRSKRKRHHRIIGTPFLDNPRPYIDPQPDKHSRDDEHCDNDAEHHVGEALVGERLHLRRPEASLGGLIGRHVHVFLF